MRIPIFLTVYLLSFSLGFSQNKSLNMEKLLNWVSEDTNITGYNDVWGYHQDNKEYAIVGSNWGTHFIDMTPGINAPIEIASFEGRANDVTWRDFKTYSHYAYGVADGDENSLQIFDLQYLPDSVVKVFDDNSVSESSHNIFIDNDRIYFCSNKINGNKSNQAIDIWSLSDPENPTHLKSFHDSIFGNSGLHDLYVKDNIAYCSAGYAGLYTYDFTDVENPILKLVLDVYPEQGYNHSSWLNDEGDRMVVADEVPSGLSLKLFDVSDFGDIELLDIFHSHKFATPHNPYFLDNKIVVSYYLDGIQVFDYSDKYNVTRVAYYDTYPDDTNYTTIDPFNGCWGAYPFLPSENILGSDRTYGLFSLKIDEQAFSHVVTKDLTNLLYTPNPFNQWFEIKAEKPIKNIWMYNNIGALVASLEGNLNEYQKINTAKLPSGKYILAILYADDDFRSIKVIKE